MSLNKRKIFVSDTSDEDDSLKHRRSSLQVNLSYSENLIDSGNGSLWRTEIENDERDANAIRTVRPLSRGKKSIYEKDRQPDLILDNKNMQTEKNTKKYTINNDSEMSVRIKEGIQLKRLTINLEDINTKERYLETSCKRLKDAILCKTKQIFDKKNELSVKTAMVLGNRDNDSTSSTHNPNVRDETVMPDKTDCCLKEKEVGKHEQYNDRQRKNQHSDIITTPTKSDRRRSFEKTIDKSRLTQRRLFNEKDKQVEGQTKCKIIEDIILKENLPLLSVRQANSEQLSDSPILSGSNKRFSLFKARAKLRSQNQFENLNNSTVHSIQNIDIGTPVLCSTFIKDNTIADKGIDNNDAFPITNTRNKVISMEMTEVYGGIYTSKEHISLQNRNSDANNCNENSKEEKATENNMKRDKTASNLENIEHPINKITIQNERSTISDSSDSIRSSLNVNTSLDAVTEIGKARNVRRLCIDHKTNDENFEGIISNKQSLDLNDQHESANTNRTSLEMNTSVDSMRKTWQRRNNKDDKNRNHSSIDTEYSSKIENKKMNDIDSLENISLIERLRNISMRNQVSCNDKSRVSKIKDEDKRRSSNSGDSYSYVEGTPYPISRSVLFRSQLKYKTQHLDDGTTCNNDLNSMDEETINNIDKTKSVILHSKGSNEMHMSIETQKIETTTVFLDNTPSCNPFITQNQLTVIKDTPDETKSETNGNKNMDVQNAKCIPGRKGRRRLLPLNENSQCSISPVEERNFILEESTSIRRNKKLKKKVPKRKSIRSKNNINNIKKEIASKQMWSDSDCDILENKKKEKKMRKPKKIISKKIFIKKFADENVLNILQGSRQNKDHLVENDSDDFVKCHTKSTQWNKYKSQKIVIATTGLSKGDKSLVKSIVKSLGTAEMELNVSRRTTHVVSTGVRTVNLLRGIIRGCWLVTLEWVLKSLENNAWLNPETFEMKHFSKAVQENRKDRQLFGSSYIPELFTACGLIYIERKTTVPYDTLKELIKTAGGHITENIKLAKIIIGANGLKETWVIDSITTGELQSTKLYQWK